MDPGSFDAIDSNPTQPNQRLSPCVSRRKTNSNSDFTSESTCNSGPSCLVWFGRSNQIEIEIEIEIDIEIEIEIDIDIEPKPTQKGASDVTTPLNSPGSSSSSSSTVTQSISMASSSRASSSMASRL